MEARENRPPVGPPSPEPLKIYQRMERNTLKGIAMDVEGFLKDLDYLILTGAMNSTILTGPILEIGSDPLIWLGAYNKLADNVARNNLPQIRLGLMRAHYLGMNQPSTDPRRQIVVDQINRWNSQYQEDPDHEQKLEQDVRLIAKTVGKIMKQYGVTEAEAIEILRGKPPIPNPPKGGLLTRRGFLKGATILGALALAASKVPDILTVPSPRPVQENPEPEQSTTFDEFIKPMKEEALRRRKERAEADPEFSRRIDPELNKDRINILLFMTGAFLRHGHEPVTNRANQIISYNTETKTIDLISITGDVRGPKAEQYAQSKGQPPKILGINNALETGRDLGGSEEEGMRLMRETFEEATGLSIDFQGIGTSGTIKDFIDQVFDGIEVDVPYDFNTFKVEIDGTEYPDHLFKQGEQEMDGVRVVQYIAADDYERLWTKMKDKLHHNRKHIIFDALRKALEKNLANPVFKAIFGAKFLAFLKPQLDQRKLKLDFEIGKILNFGVFTDPKSFTRPPGFDQINQGESVLIVSHVYGGQGVRMVAEDADHNPKSRKDLDSRYSDLWWMQIPPNSNPDSEDLLTDYWGVPGGPREIVKNRLLSSKKP